MYYLDMTIKQVHMLGEPGVLCRYDHKSGSDVRGVVYYLDMTSNLVLSDVRGA